MTKREVQSVEKLAYTVAETVKATGISQSTLYELMSRGELKGLKVGNKRLFLRRELEAFLERHAAAENP